VKGGRIRTKAVKQNIREGEKKVFSIGRESGGNVPPLEAPKNLMTKKNQECLSVVYGCTAGTGKKESTGEGRVKRIQGAALKRGLVFGGSIATFRSGRQKALEKETWGG